jgi:hypothetical protein
MEAAQLIARKSRWKLICGKALLRSADVLGVWSPAVMVCSRAGAADPAYQPSTPPVRQPMLPAQAQQGNGEAATFQGPEEGGHRLIAFGGP